MRRKLGKVPSIKYVHKKGLGGMPKNKCSKGGCADLVL